MHGPASSTAAEEIDRLLAEWAEAVEAADVEAISALVTPDAESWSHGAAPLVGREPLQAAMSDLFQRFQVTQRFDCIELVIRDDITFMRGTERNTLKPLDGGASTNHDQRAFSVLQRGSDGVWRFWRGMTNLPPKAEP